MYDGGPDITGRDHEQGNFLAETLGDGDGACEQGLLVVAENLLGNQIVSSRAKAADAGGHDDDILVADVEFFQGPAQVDQGVVIAHGNQHVATANVKAFALNGIALQQLELVVHVVVGRGFLLSIGELGDGEDEEENRGKCDAADGGDGLGEKVDECRGEQDHGDRGHAEGDLVASDSEIDRHFPAALAFVFEAEHEHGEALEGEAPDDTEGISLAQGVHIAAAGHDGEDLKDDDQVDDAIAGAEPAMGEAEPVGEDAIFRDAVQDAIGADDGGIDGAGKNEKPDDHDKATENEAQEFWPVHIHGQAGDEVVLVDGNADRIGDQHHGEEGGQSGEDEAVEGDDDGRLFQVPELGVGELAIDLGERLFAAHGENGVPEGDHDAEDSEFLRETLIREIVMEEAERFLCEMEVSWSGQRHMLVSDLEEGEGRPAQQGYNHDGCDLHDPERFFAGLVDTLDIFPPVVNGDGEGEEDGSPVNVELGSAVENVVNGARDPAMSVSGDHDLVDEANDVLAGGHTGDRAGQDVIKHQCGDTEFCEGASKRLFDDFIDAAADEHGAALDVDGAHREREEHDSDDEPGGGLADGLLSDAAGVESGGGEVVENDGRGAPEGDEGEHHRRGDDDANAVRTVVDGLDGG